MKKTLIFIALMAIGAGANAQKPQYERESPRNLIKMNPFYLIDNTFLLGLEHFAQDFSTSLEVQLGVIASSNPVEGRDGFTSGFMGEFYVKKHIVNRFNETPDQPVWMEGLYFAPYLQFKYIKSNFTTWGNPGNEVNVEITSFGVGTVFGAHISISRGFYIEPYLGGGVKFGNADADDPTWRRNWEDIFTPEYTGIYPKPGIKFGAKL